MSKETRVAIVSGARTPFVKAMTVFKNQKAEDLSVAAVNGTLEKSGIDVKDVDFLSWGITVVDSRIPNMARHVVLNSNLTPSTRAMTITDNCISGTSAIQHIYHQIKEGRIEVGIAGGVDSMSNPVLRFNEKATRIFADSAFMKTMGEQLKAFSKLRPKDFFPERPGVAEPFTGLTMGEHCELMVKEWNISREAQDELAARSHQRAAAATEDGRLGEEIVPVNGVEKDGLVRPGTTAEKLAGLKPCFDRSSAGTLTAANSSALTDGASAVMLMSEERAKKEGLEILAFIEDFEVASIDPDDGLLMAPAVAMPRMLKRNKVTFDDLDIVEVHEAFAGQVECNRAAWKQGWKEPAVGEIPEDKLNPQGSSIALGHPFSATGGRIALSLALQLKRTGGKRGAMSVCAAGASGTTMLLSRD
ncbi:3-ketoacyl-CoA thiolase [gamma proteobacterium HTCC5015]|nr:3-ketoacyl-CoA thiolase [gamma proteobacterium HTCC5015]